MNAREFLEQLKKLDRLIANKLIEKEQWRSIATGTTAHSDGERVQSSGSQQKMADAVVRYINIEQEIDAVIDQLVDTKKDVISVIEQLKPDEYDVLHKRYVQYMELYEVAEQYEDKSYSWVTTTHGRGIKHVQDILDSRKDEVCMN